MPAYPHVLPFALCLVPGNVRGQVRQGHSSGKREQKQGADGNAKGWAALLKMGMGGMEDGSRLQIPGVTHCNFH